MDIASFLSVKATIIYLIRNIGAFETIVIVIYIIVTAYQLLLWVVFFGKFLFYRIPQKVQSSLPSVSIVIAIKNELSNLKLNLKKVIEQDYPKLEVIVVNDHSTDESKSWLTAIATANEHVTVIDSDNENNGKKAAIAKGIAHARGHWILTTDADCYPKYNQWVRSMMQESGSADIIIGHSPFVHDNTVLNRFTRYENRYIALQYFSAAMWGFPYMAVGRNFAYKKDLFVKVNGFNRHIEKLSGDDDLLLNDMKDFGSVAICTNHKAHVSTAPKTSLCRLIHQKTRHISTSHDYKNSIKCFLASIFLSQLFHYLIAAYLLYLGYIQLALFGLLIRGVIIAVVIYGSKKHLGKNTDWITGWPFDLIVSAYYTFLSFRLFRKVDSWK